MSTMRKTTPFKPYVCSLCGQVRKGNISGENICWLCVQRLLNSGQGKIKELYNKLLERGLKNKAWLIENWIEEEVEKYEEFRRSVERTGNNRQVRFVKQRWKK